MSWGEGGTTEFKVLEPARVAREANLRPLPTPLDQDFRPRSGSKTQDVLAPRSGAPDFSAPEIRPGSRCYRSEAARVKLLNSVDLYSRAVAPSFLFVVGFSGPERPAHASLLGMLLRRVLEATRVCTSLIEVQSRGSFRGPEWAVDQWLAAFPSHSLPMPHELSSEHDHACASMDAGPSLASLCLSAPWPPAGDSRLRRAPSPLEPTDSARDPPHTTQPPCAPPLPLRLLAVAQRCDTTIRRITHRRLNHSSAAAASTSAHLGSSLSLTHVGYSKGEDI